MQWIIKKGIETMEISLKIELSDEQYNDIMNNSYDAIYKDEKLIEGLREIILTTFQRYFNDTNNKGAITGIIRDVLMEEEESKYTYYGAKSYKPTELCKKIVLGATENQLAHLRNNIRIVAARLLSNREFINQAISEVIIDSIKIGLASGNDSLMKEKRTTAELAEMAWNRLNYKE